MESIKVEVKSCDDTAIVQHSAIKNEVPIENKNVEDTACDTNIQVAQKGNFGSGTNAIQVDDNYIATNPKQSQSKPRKSEIIDDNSINRSRSRSRREGDHESRPLSALDIQMQSGDYYRILKRSEKCAIMCGFESLAIIILIYSISVGNFYFFYTYTHYLKRLDREYTWIFLLLAAVSFSLSSFFCYLIINAIFFYKGENERIKEAEINKQKMLLKNALRRNFRKVLSRPRGLTQEISRVAEKKIPLTKKCLISMWRVYRSISDVNGKYYILKMQITEIIENTNQLVNFVTIYVCTLPLGIIGIMFFAFFVEIVHNNLNLLKTYSPTIRNRQLLLDVIVDFLYFSVPLGYGGYYELPLKITFCLQLMIIPNVFMLNRVNDIFLDLYSIDLQRIDPDVVAQKQRQSRRQSVYKSKKMAILIKEQGKHFSRWQRMFYGILMTLYAAFVFIIFNIQLWYEINPQTESTCNELYSQEIWPNCLIKVPLCQNIFEPRCDCGILYLHKYPKKNFSSSFGNMKSLMKLNVFDSPLEELPSKFVENHKRLVHLQFMKTGLRQLPIELGGWGESMLNLWISDSNLQSIPSSIGRLKNLKSLMLSRNKLSEIPNSIVNIEGLIALWINGNTIRSFPKNFETKLTNLNTIYIQNNRFDTIPLNKHLSTVLAWNNRLKSLRSDIGKKGKGLRVLDIRNNNITNELPTSIATLKKRLNYLYLAGNPICNSAKYIESLKSSNALKDNAKSTLCMEQCAADCPSLWLDDDYCDDGLELYGQANRNLDIKSSLRPAVLANSTSCNVEKCLYDDGDCIVPSE